MANINVKEEIKKLTDNMNYIDTANVTRYFNFNYTIDEGLDELVQSYSGNINTYKKLMLFLNNNIESLEDVVKSGNYVVDPQTYDIFDHVQAAQQYLVKSAVENDKDKFILLAAYAYCEQKFKPTISSAENNQIKRIVKMINPKTDTFEDLYADSLDLVEIIIECEQEFGYPIRDDRTQNLKTVGDLVNLITDLDNKDYLESTQADLQIDE